MIIQGKTIPDAGDPVLESLKKAASRVPGVIYQFKLGPDGRPYFPFVSDKVKEIYGLDPEVIIKDASVAFSMIHPDDLQEVYNSVFHAVHTSGSWQMEFRLLFPDGIVRWFSGNAAPEKESDGSLLWYGYISDITEAKKKTEELIQQKIYNQQLINEITIQEQETERNKVSYELHENISQILAGAKIYLGMDIKKENVAAASVQKGLTLLDDAIGLINKMSYELTPSFEVLDLAEVVNELVNRENAHERINIEFVNEMNEPMVTENRLKLMFFRIIESHLQNIQKFTDAGSASVRLQLKNKVLMITMTDDRKNSSSAADDFEFGLQHIRNRVEFYKGGFTVRDQDETGFLIEIEVPL